MSDIRSLEPSSLWSNFADLNAVPRPSKKEEKVIEFVKKFGEDLGLDTTVDDCGNVIIKKPGTTDMLDRKTIVLQSHLDMVHQKNADTNFDFDNEGIKMYVDEDWVKAEGTTLGADNGIGVASIMSILQSTDISHPNIEALFTIDEETGMTGASGLKGGLLDGDILLNLDTEDDKEICIGCAGGIDITAEGRYIDTEPTNDRSFRIKLSGLNGGHSGMDIHLGRGNANKLMNRVLSDIMEEHRCEIAGVDGGGLRNAIPRESFATITCSAANLPALKDGISALEKILKREYHSTDPNLKLELEEIDMVSEVMGSDEAKAMVNAIYSCQNGIYRMSPDMEDLVQTSNNIARVLIENGKYSIQCLTRSSVDSEKMDLAKSIKATFALIGAEVNFAGSYPGWTPKPEADIVSLMSDLYRNKFNEEPMVNACHAGLECGILGTNYPDMEMISFGPNIRGAHSPDEKVQISSVQKYWSLLLDTLSGIPLKN